MNPVVAVVAGIVILGERLTWLEALGAVVVLASVLIVLQRPGDDAAPPGTEATTLQERTASNST